jgi:hypothetical protein
LDYFSKPENQLRKIAVIFPYSRSVRSLGLKLMPKRQAQVRMPKEFKRTDAEE